MEGELIPVAVKKKEVEQNASARLPGMREEAGSKHELLERIRKIRKKAAEGEIRTHEQSLLERYKYELFQLMLSEKVGHRHVTDDIKEGVREEIMKLTEPNSEASTYDDMEFENIVPSRYQERVRLAADGILEEKRTKRDDLKKDLIIKLGRELKKDRAVVAVWIEAAIKLIKQRREDSSDLLTPHQG